MPGFPLEDAFFKDLSSNYFKWNHQEWERGSKMKGYKYIHTYLIHFFVQQKLTQHYKLIILHIKKYKRRESR